jgi:hypothetical protein
MTPPRPSRAELVRHFFPELGDTLTQGDTEALISLNTRACEVILADHVKHYDRFYGQHGPGVMCINLARQNSPATYATCSDLRKDLELAQSSNHAPVADMLRSVLETVEATDVAEKVLVMLIDNSRTSLLPIPREYPARAIQAMQEEFTA